MQWDERAESYNLLIASLLPTWPPSDLNETLSLLGWHRPLEETRNLRTEIFSFLAEISEDSDKMCYTQKRKHYGHQLLIWK